MSNNVRQIRLQKHFESAIRTPNFITSTNSKQFIESIVVQSDAPSCTSKLASSPHALVAIQAAMRYDLSPTFLNGDASSFLKYLRSSNLQEINQGVFVQEIVKAICSPAIFWKAFLEAFLTDKLAKESQLGLAWLYAQVMGITALKQPCLEEVASLVDEVPQKLIQSHSRELKEYGLRIQEARERKSAPALINIRLEDAPGGRHDNDFKDYRDISTLPTSEEILSNSKPFLRRASDIDEVTEHKGIVHLDNQFRLLREDMLSEMRESIQQFEETKGSKKRYRGFHLQGLSLEALYCGDARQRIKWCLVFRSKYPLPHLNAIPIDNQAKRKKHLQENRSVIKHGSLVAVLLDDKISAFGLLNRHEDFLIGATAAFVIQFEGHNSVTQLLVQARLAQDISILQIDTAIFAYEPILLRLQAMTQLPLEDELLHYKVKCGDFDAKNQRLQDLIQRINVNPIQDLQALLATPKSIELDRSQYKSLIMGLMQTVPLIQGPPGTGKSFIGSLLAKILHDFTDYRILIVCYTNHALDDVLLGLRGIGIGDGSMVRLGSKSDSKVEDLSLFKQSPRSYKLTKSDWNMIDLLKDRINEQHKELETLFKHYISYGISNQEIMEYIEFEDPGYYGALCVPTSEDGMLPVGANGKQITPMYLYHQWTMGWNGGFFRGKPPVVSSPVWQMPRMERLAVIEKWKATLIRERVEAFVTTAKKYNDEVESLARKRSVDTIHVLQNKRIIACTTTGAAKYTNEIQAACPDVLLVEEAGEILESHVLTSLGAHIKKLILIGDHQQLRPKVNNYALTMERGQGFDLNVSLFERLIRQEYTYSTLSQQHRMRPEISDLIRQLTYPGLVDAPATKNRPTLRGIRDNIVFINHAHPETKGAEVKERMDPLAKASKENQHEVDMVVSIVRYLAQQGYGTDDVVVLTPYLGQLHKLRSAFIKHGNDPVLSDLDHFDLVRAGLMTSATAKLVQKRLRLSTIDNFQGEESDIIIISLTRSNVQHDIGFMMSPERVNVLLSRARNAMIMIGNAETFRGSRSGGKLWSKVLDLLTKGGHVYDGLPVKCEQHPQRVDSLKKSQDFHDKCPDGGCTEPCDHILSCGVHKCPSRCHQIYDHSKMECEAIVEDKCPQNHVRRLKCYQGPAGDCPRCIKEKENEEKRKKKAAEQEAKREAEQKEHLRKMAELEAEMDKEKDKFAEEQRAKERALSLAQRQRDLEQLKKRATAGEQPIPGAEAQPTTPPRPQVKSAKAPPLSPPTAFNISPKISPLDKADAEPSTMEMPPSAMEVEWVRRKNFEGDHNEAIDKIMQLTGLEDVKKKVLDIKDKISVSARQGVKLDKERFNIVFLGNPGTGKTTVAREYAKFLASVQVIPGQEFIETTGSRLAQAGVSGAKKHIEDVLAAGGGAIFIDEAYQLTEGHNAGGRQVLDFLLAEMENNIGKVIFILAGYNRNMEKFFEHNPGLPSRVPYRVQFADYSDPELLQMFVRFITDKYSGKMKIEDGMKGLYSRIAIRRLGRGRGSDGFGNARALQILAEKLMNRQATRVADERRRVPDVDDFLLKKEDLIGPEPSETLKNNKSWKALQDMTGLQSVKLAVQSLFNVLQTNYWRELRELRPLEVTLNRIFLGSPGTGKTTVAKLYGQILADLGFLSSGEVIVKNPSDFIGSVLGASESNTKGILAATVGKVLVIDEAYMLYKGSNGGGDLYSSAVIDTIVAEVQNVPGEDRCVLLLGYKDQMEAMIQNVNPGLARRFSVENAFTFEDFTEPELRIIFEAKLKAQNLTATRGALDAAMEVLSRTKRRPNFGNAGEIENLISQAKMHSQKRTTTMHPKDRINISFVPTDFDPEFGREQNASDNLAKLFEDVVGCDHIVARLGKLQKVAKMSKERGLDTSDLIPTNFVFKGPPGTGKTTIARKMGKVYYDMGYLSSPEVIEASATDLVAQFVGQTGEKTKKLLEKGLGRVLFIDEAYRLGEGHFAKEAIDELVTLLTHPTFLRKIIVILAGYTEDIERLMSINSGLQSRFSEHIDFLPMSSDHCITILRQELSRRQVIFSTLDDTQSAAYKSIQNTFDRLVVRRAWGNARDVKTLASSVVNSALLHADGQDLNHSVSIDDAEVMNILNNMLDDLMRREERSLPSISRPLPNFERQVPSQPPPPLPTFKTATKTAKAQLPPVETVPPPVADVVDADVVDAVDSVGRDAGVSDDAWRQLQVDKHRAEEIERKEREEIEEADRRARTCQQEGARIKRILERTDKSKQDDEMKRQREQARLAAANEQKKLSELRRLAQLRKRQEEAVQVKLRELGICPAGYRWVKQDGGYRCSAGGHYMSNAALGL